MRAVWLLVMELTGRLEVFVRLYEKGVEMLSHTIAIYAKK
jgi:hypothetical protein